MRIISGNQWRGRERTHRQKHNLAGPNEERPVGKDIPVARLRVKCQERTAWPGLRGSWAGARSTSAGEGGWTSRQVFCFCVLNWS